MKRNNPIAQPVLCKRITREEFVKICNDAILKTREEITISNQISGYIKYHNAIKNEEYFKKLRLQLKKHNKKSISSLFYRHEITKHAKMANCGELADYLAAEIILRIKECDGNIIRVTSKIESHGYIRIKIHLENETTPSLWEVDAWDPRIIDISMREDGTMNNQAMLDYGCDPITLFTIPIKDPMIASNSLDLDFPSPEEGPPSRDATPVKDMHEKHPKLFKDYSIDNARESKKILNADGTLSFSQLRSRR